MKQKKYAEGQVIYAFKQAAEVKSGEAQTVNGAKVIATVTGHFKTSHTGSIQNPPL
jgi:hypothetical protein